MPSLSARSCSSRFSILASLGALALVGCGEVGGPDDVQQVAGDVSPITAPPATAATIAFQPFSDDVAAQAGTESRTLIRSARGYQAVFGHAPPAAVDFSREWVMFYAAGAKPTGGYEASFLAVLRAGRSLIAITRLDAPGAGCLTTQAFTTPYALIKFPAQDGASAQFFKQDTTRACGPSLCAAVQCQTGSDCDPATGKCVPGSVRCGGIAGIACPGFGKCVDDPNDSCDPARGGADCGGICSCVQNVACDANSNFDSSPSVCACVPVKPPVCPPVCKIYCQYGNVPDANGCPTCTCNPDPCATVKCAAGTHCDAGKCAADGPSCGGIAGTPCPGAGKCVDDPRDSCDPARGGADCGGICSCVQNVACTVNTTFDSSPSVCACVPVKPPVCGPVCDIYCQYGNELDANGCPTCRCNPPPVDPCSAVLCPPGTQCTAGKCVSTGPSCGGIAGKPCPGLGKCVDDPNDGCDPAAGGADCGGICSCIQNVACTADSKFDSSPSVCACVPVKPPVCGPVCAIACPNGNVLDANGCPTCQCNPPPTDPCATVKCAAGTHCDGGKCLSNGVTCGGFTGKPCPGMGKCVDDPSDSCDPARGGADCGGLCSCVQNVACTTTSRFDSSPSVCACVPATCPPEKCPAPGPKSASMMCADGSIAGPTCALTADGVCGWTVTRCP
jgi:hypothetical protein